MGSHIVEVLRQGIWASLTGGWFYDPRQTVFCNGLHLYLWLFLVFLPFTINLLFSFTAYSITAYCLVTLVLSCVIKGGVKYLHSIFDTHEFTEEDVGSQTTTTAHTKELAELPGEQIELPVLQDADELMPTFSGAGRERMRVARLINERISTGNTDGITTVPIATSDSSQSSSDQDAMVSAKSPEATGSRKSESTVTQEKWLDLKVISFLL